MNLQRLQHFVSVADSGSLSRAATREGLSQPALSKSIAKLEEELGMRLFDRRGSLELTELGKQVLRRVRVFVEAGGDLKHDLMLLRGGAAGDLQVGCGPIMAESLLGPAVARLLEAEPGLRVTARIESIDMLEPMLRSRQLDFILGDLDQLQHREDYEVIRFPPAEIVWFGRRGHPLAGGSKVSLDEFFAHPIVLPTMPAWAQAWFDELVPEEKRPFRPAFLCSHYQSLIEVVKNTESICGSTMGAVTRDLKAGVIERIDLARPILPLQAGAVYLSGRSLSPPAEMLIREFDSQIGDLRRAAG